MKINKLLIVFALAVGLGSTIWLTWNLIINFPSSIAFIEPDPYYRIPEIIMGFFAVPILIKVLWGEYRK